MGYTFNSGRFKWIKKFFLMISMAIAFPLYATLNLSNFHEQDDHYRWMESEPDRLTNWIFDQSDKAEEQLDTLPWRESIMQRIKEINANPTALRIVRVVDESANQFYLRITPEFPYWRFFIKKPLENEKVLIEPPFGNRISFTVPSPDGKYVVYGFSESSSEFSTLRIRHVDSNTDLVETIVRVRYPEIAWRADNRSFFYSRLPTIQENTDPTNLLNSKIYLHKLGDDFIKDEVVFGAGIDSLTEIIPTDSLSIETTFDTSWLVGSITPSISGYSSSLYISREADLNGSKTQWRKIYDKSDEVEFHLLLSDQLYLVKKNATSGYSVSRRFLNDLDAKEQLLLEWSQGDFVTMNASADSLYVAYRSLGKCHLLRLPFADVRKIETVPLPFDGEVDSVFANINSHKILFGIQDWIVEPKIFSYQPEKYVVEEGNLTVPSGVDFSPYTVENKNVIAQDGTFIPFTIIRRSDIKLNSSHPVWLTGYGAYGVSIFPSFDPSRLVWLEQGGIIAIAHVRGGGELGPDWHQAGKGINKISSITDFIDCADYLVEHNYTKPEYLVASSRSAGGILVGMAVILRPDLFSAIAVDMGILNTTRLELIPIGLMNKEEFGTATTPEGLYYLHSIDPYVNLQNGVKYPATLLTVGLNDNRVSPWQSAKYIAKLQEIESTHTALLIAYSDAGHFFDSSDLLADKISFFLWKTKYKNKLL